MCIYRQKEQTPVSWLSQNDQIPWLYHWWIPIVKGHKTYLGPADNWLVHRLVDLVHTWSTKFAWKCRFAHSFMNSQLNSKIPPLSDSHRQGLQITLRVGRKPGSSSIGGLGAHSVDQILDENIGSLIASWILNRIPKFNHHRIPTIKGYKSHSGSAKNRSVHRLVHLVHTWSTEFCMKTSARS